VKWMVKSQGEIREALQSSHHLLQCMECPLCIVHGGDTFVATFDKPHTFDVCVPAWNFSSQCAWGHPAKEEATVLMSQA
jgi:hypothetical protein